MAFDFQNPEFITAAEAVGTDGDEPALLEFIESYRGCFSKDDLMAATVGARQDHYNDVSSEDSTLANLLEETGVTEHTDSEESFDADLLIVAVCSFAEIYCDTLELEPFYVT